MGKKKKKKRKEEKEAKRLAREEQRLAERERELVRVAATSARPVADPAETTAGGDQGSGEAAIERGRRGESGSVRAKRGRARPKPAPRRAPVPAAPLRTEPPADLVDARVPAEPSAAGSEIVDAEIVETGSASRRSRPANRRRPPRRAGGARRPAAGEAPTIADPDNGGVDADDEYRGIEARLNRMLRMSADPAAAERAPDVLGNDGERLAGRLGAEPPGADAARGLRQRFGSGMIDSARELLSSDYYLRVWGRLGMRGRSVEVDEYGLDPKYEEKWRPFFDFLYSTYWRVQTAGVHHIPETGRCLLVANHSGTIPYDGAMIKTAVEREHPARRKVRWLAEDFVFHFPFLGAFMNRIGAVRACQENADRMLRQERLVAVFPEGIKGIGKLYRERYRLQRFGRGGYVKLVLRTRTPIVPVGVVGAEEIHPLLYKPTYLAQALGMPYIPITPTFPALGLLGLVPAPTKWLIEFGEPIAFDDYGPDAAEDAILVNRLNDQVRTQIQDIVNRLLERRRTVLQG
ncbi:MAG: acyltransferase family protein [Deltaproteobacteria bacterium]|nr:acyltransferase family protein [Deltaproteobacteria bacterium]